MPYRNLSLVVSVGTGTTIFRKLQLPAIPKIALDIRKVRVVVSDTGDSGNPLSDLIWGLFHHTEKADLGAAGSPALWQFDAGWLFGSMSRVQYDEIVFPAGAMPVAGPQLFGISNGTTDTQRFVLQVFYEQRKVSVLEWTLLKARTSFEKN